MNIITSKTRSRMKRDPNSRQQLRAERTNYYKDQGVEKLKPLKGQTEEESFEQIKDSGSYIKDSMQERSETKRNAREKHLKETAPQRMKDAADKYFKQQNELKKNGFSSVQDMKNKIGEGKKK